MAVDIRHDDHVALSIRKELAITSPTRGGRSVGVVRSRAQTMECSFFFTQGQVLRHFQAVRGTHVAVNSRE
jgi:hypothetical protein